MSQCTRAITLKKSPIALLLQPFSPHQSEMISFILFTRTLPKTEDKVTPFSTKQDKSIPLNLGVQVELSLVFPESQVPVPLELVKPLSVTCAERHVCSLHLRSGENGTLKSTSLKEELLLLRPSLLPHAPHSSWPEVISLKMSQNSHSSSTTWPSQTPSPSLPPFSTSELEMISPRSENPRRLRLVLVNIETQDTS